MMDFIYKLYNSDNFTLYLTIALVILVILFVIVLIFGKKDQKLEETKRLQKIELEHAFKEEKEEPIKLETTKDEIVDKKEEVKPEVEPINQLEENNDVNVTVFEPVLNNEQEDIVLPEEEPELEIDEISASLEEGINNLENIKNEFKNIEIPGPDIEEEKPKEFQPSSVFSSVYVPLESEPKITNVEEPNPSKPTLLAQDEEDDDEFALPDLVSNSFEEVDNSKALSTETNEKTQNPTSNMNTFSFDELPNETYKL